ncbi:helix-turn-helix domain-containing protein [Paramuribaculum intestinale]|uniref:helix-turn-helix domain-containing protein n=1 Tax=Paramuribaculum intestinale TaxID=2094151 RepID=UPI00342317DF
MTKKEVAERLGVCETTVYNMTKDGRLHPFKVNGSTRYSLREVNSIINPSNDD